ncbi:diguanylate phosphodiesterase [Psychromonas sp. PRT-SC03]|nr:diguanylate phosphodiesterase [Psychromonas sp. PRT-SC03]
MNKISALLPTDELGDLSLLQITDAHLFADIDHQLLGVKTARSFKAVVQLASKDAPFCQAILATGDLTQDHSAQSYLTFSHEIKTLNLPCYWLPGNHDVQSVMLPNLLEEGLAPIKLLHSKYWQIILLDSQIPNMAHGRLSVEQLDFLKKALMQHPDKYTLICVHHHVLPVGSAWLDEHILKNHQDFLDVIRPFKGVRAVLSGHVHQEQENLLNAVTFFTSPSTCVQFKPNSDDFALDGSAPGYRYLSLRKDGSIKTRIERVEHGLFSADIDSKGY